MKKRSSAISKLLPPITVCDSAGGQGPQRAVTAETPVAWLRRIIARRIRKARREIMARGYCYQWSAVASIAELVSLANEACPKPRATGVGGND